VAGRAIAFGKTALVANAAGLIRRTRRLHLVTGPMPTAARERLARALGSPAHGRSPPPPKPRSTARWPPASPMRAVLPYRRPPALGRRPTHPCTAAQDLHALERKLPMTDQPQPGARHDEPAAGPCARRCDPQRDRQGVVGQEEIVDHLLIALMARGHVLLEGPPGTAKTFPGAMLRRQSGARFRAHPVHPDLMPGDILGSNLFNFQTSQFTLTRGPIFCDLLLADEINRTPPKTQAALLEAMQERRVTLDGTAL
jgi:hypothetical protein